MMQVTVTVNGDTTVEPNENFTVDLSAAVNATISDNSGTGTITNDDGNVTVSGSTGADGQYVTLQAAFAALNANGTQGGNTISVTIIGNTAETATAVLNQPSVSSWTSLTVSPSGARTVSGSLAAPLVDLELARTT